MSAVELFETAQEHRRNKRFGDAVNMYRQAAESPDACDELKRKCMASIELIQDINAFVNADLMNP